MARVTNSCSRNMSKFSFMYFSCNGISFLYMAYRNLGAFVLKLIVIVNICLCSSRQDLMERVGKILHQEGSDLTLKKFFKGILSYSSLFLSFYSSWPTSLFQKLKSKLAVFRLNSFLKCSSTVSQDQRNVISISCSTTQSWNPNSINGSLQLQF